MDSRRNAMGGERGVSMAAEQAGADHGTAPQLRDYANDLAARFSLSEVELQFGQRFGPDGALSVHTFIVTSPVHLVTFSRVISQTIAAYEGRYGVIPAPVDGQGG